jgi:hypothetical protein
MKLLYIHSNILLEGSHLCEVKPHKNSCLGNYVTEAIRCTGSAGRPSHIKESDSRLAREIRHALKNNSLIIVADKGCVCFRARYKL